MPQEVHEVHRCAHQEEVFGTNQDGESYPPGQIPPFMEKRKGEEEDPKEEAVVLEVDVVDDEESGGPEEEGESDAAAEGREAAGEAADAEEEGEVGGGDGEALEEECGGGGVVLAGNEVDDGGIEERGGEGEEELEVGEERGVVEGPRAGGVRVPADEGEGGGESEPVAVDLEVGAVVRRHQEEFDACRHAPEPSHLLHRRCRPSAVSAGLASPVA